MCDTSWRVADRRGPTVLPPNISAECRSLSPIIDSRFQRTFKHMSSQLILEHFVCYSGLAGCGKILFGKYPMVRSSYPPARLAAAYPWCIRIKPWLWSASNLCLIAFDIESNGWTKQLNMQRPPNRLIAKSILDQWFAFGSMQSSIPSLSS